MIDLQFLSLLCCFVLLGMAGHSPCCFCKTCSDGDGRAPAELLVTLDGIARPGSPCLCDATCANLNGSYVVAREEETIYTDQSLHRHCKTTYSYTYDWLCDDTDCGDVNPCYPTLWATVDYDETADSTSVQVQLYYAFSDDAGGVPCHADSSCRYSVWWKTIAGKLECATLDLDVNDGHSNSLELCTTIGSTCNVGAAP